MDFQDRQDKLINEVVDVFERNDADMFEMFRVLSIMAAFTRTYLIDNIGELKDELESRMAELEGESE